MSKIICLSCGSPEISVAFKCEDCGDQSDNAMRLITAEQQTRTRLADNYGSYFRFMSQMYGGD